VREGGIVLVEAFLFVGCVWEWVAGGVYVGKVKLVSGLKAFGSQPGFGIR